MPSVYRASPEDVDRFIQALVDYAEAIEDVGPLETERDALFAKIQSGDASTTLHDSSVNGKSFGWQINLTLEQKFQAFVQAVKEFKGTKITSTYADFSDLQR